MKKCFYLVAVLVILVSGFLTFPKQQAHEEGPTPSAPTYLAHEEGPTPNMIFVTAYEEGPLPTFTTNTFV